MPLQTDIQLLRRIPILGSNKQIVITYAFTLLREPPRPQTFPLPIDCGIMNHVYYYLLQSVSVQAWRNYQRHRLRDGGSIG
jgi:hypothetical protein